MSTEFRNAARAAAVTAGFTFIVLFGGTATEAAQQVIEWASTSGAQPLPEISTLGYGFVSAVGSVVVGALNFLVRFAQSKLGMGTPPSYEGAIETSGFIKG